MPTIQDFDQAETRRIAGARAPLVTALTTAAVARPWHYLLFGSLARGTARRGSDADIAIVGANGAWREAECAALDACGALGLAGDVMLWEDLSPAVQAEALRDGIRCD